MARAIANYAYLHARSSVLAERLLDSAQFDALIDAAPEQALLVLRDAGLREADSDTLADPARLEQALINALVSDFTLLSRALSGVERALLIYWARRFELSNLKAIIRGKLAEQPADAIRAELVDLGPFATLPVDELLAADDPAELLRRLDATPYADIAHQARAVFEEHHDAFALDAAIDRRYFVGLDQRINELGADDRRLMRRLAGSLFDRINLVWLLRYRFGYGLAPAETYYLLIPAGYQLHRRELQALAQLGSFAEVLAHLPQPLADRLVVARTTSDVDALMQAESVRVATGILRRSAFNLARSFAFLVLRERDIFRLQAVLKGKHLKIDPAAIRAAQALG